MRSLSDVQPGQSIGRYEFLVPIAEGGMASVWAARMKGSRGFQKNLAIKMMLAKLSDDPMFEEMFLDEARIASRIHHPNVVEIFDLGEENEVLYIVMEYVDGEPLSAIWRTALKKSGMPIGIAVRIIADAAAGLHAAHELVDEDGKQVGLVHRDVSPQNILVTYDGNVKIVDFGVVLAHGRESAKTGVGTVKGKASYMSPEQALGQTVDRRTDLFALGIVLYQLTTGRHPFKGESEVATLRNILDQPCPPPSQHVPSYPKTLEAVVMKALEKDPNRRFQTCAEFEAALDRVMPPTAPRVRPADVGRFVREVVGERGERRRDALKSAVKLADEQWANQAEAQRLMARPVHDIGMTGQFSAVQGLPSGMYPLEGLPPPSRPSINPSTGSQPSITSIASPGVYASMPPSGATAAPKKAPVLAMVAASLVVVLGLGGGVFAATRSRGSKAASPPPPVAAKTAEAPSASVSVAAPSVTSAPAAQSTAATIDALPSVAAAHGTTRQAGPAPEPRAGAAEKEPKPEKETKPKPPSGFAPPPLQKPDFLSRREREIRSLAAAWLARGDARARGMCPRGERSPAGRRRLVGATRRRRREGRALDLCAEAARRRSRHGAGGGWRAARVGSGR